MNGHIQPPGGIKVSSLHYASLAELLKQARINAFGLWNYHECDTQIIQFID